MDLSAPPESASTDPEADPDTSPPDDRARRESYVRQESPEAPRVIGGVCELIAARLGFDPLWIRIGFVALALAGGVGLVAYGGLWLVLIVGPQRDSRPLQIVGGAALVIGIPLMLDSGPRSFMTGTFAIVLLLLGLTAALWRPGGVRPQRPLPPPLWPQPQSHNWSPPVAATAAAESMAATAPMNAAEPEPAARSFERLPRLTRPRRQPSMLGRATLGLAIVTAAGGALIDQSNGGRLYPQQWLGAAAIVCGAGLLVGTILGRGRWLIIPAALFAVVGFAGGRAAKFGISDFHQLIGDEYLSVDSSTVGPITERVGIGSIYVNIAEPPAAPLVVDTSVGIGSITISARDDVTIRVEPRLDDGSMIVEGSYRAVETVTIGPEGLADVTIRASIGVGDVRVERYGAETGEYYPVADPLLTETELAPSVRLRPDGIVVLGEADVLIPLNGEPFAASDVGQVVLIPGGRLLVTPYGEFRWIEDRLLVGLNNELLDIPDLRRQILGIGVERAPLASVSPPPTAPTAPTTPVTNQEGEG